MQLQAALELNRRYLGERLQRPTVIGSSADTARYLTAELRHQPHEVFACLFLDNRHRVLAFEPLFYGTIDAPRYTRGWWSKRRCSITPRP